MRIILLLLSFLATLANAQTVRINETGTTVNINGSGRTVLINAVLSDDPDPDPPLGLDYTKNFRIIEDVSSYDAFGHIQRTGPDRVTHYYRSGTSHLVGGVIKGRHYTLSTDTWGSPFTIFTDPGGLDMRDVWGGRMDNGESVLFTCSSELLGLGYPYTSYMLMMKGDGETFGTPDTVFNGTFPRMQRGLPFGGIVPGIDPGTYYIAMWQFNYDSGTADKPTFPLYRIDVLKTTDYFDTWTAMNVYENTAAITECVVAVYAGTNEDSLSVFIRRDPGGFLTLYESTNGGSSFVSRGNVGEVGLNATKSKMPFLLMNSDGTMHITVGDRDDGWMKISRNNTSSYFGGNNINTGELYAFNTTGAVSAGDLYKLGYPSMLEIEPGKHMYVYAKQISSSKAVNYYTLDDMSDDEGMPIDPPEIVINPAYINSTDAFVYIKMEDMVGGYTPSQLQHIRWFEWSVSVDSFATFETLTVIYPIGDNSYTGVIEDFRLASHMFNIYDLTPATTYQVRVRAVNLNGTSNYATAEFTTD